MYRFRRRFGQDHETKTHCAATADSLNQSPDYQLPETQRSTAYPRANGGEQYSNYPDGSMAEDFAYHREEQLTGSTDSEIGRAGPERAGEWLVKCIRQFLSLSSAISST